MILDLFAGPGGWSEGLRLLGLSDVGIEWDASACRTRAAAGHLTIRADVAQYPPARFAGKVTGLIASPPCQDFSMAGKKAGRTGDKGQLIDTVPEWVDAIRPRWVACEQVPPALPVWEEFARLFQTWGYSTWAGVLNAADYGVPQTRRRAILLASLDGPAHPPTPTHAKTPEVGLFGSTEPWVTMAQALGWGGFEAHYQRGAGLTERHGERPGRRDNEPAPTLTGAALGSGGGAKLRFHLRAGAMPNATVRADHEPAPTVLASWDNGDTRWLHTNRGQDEDGNRQQVADDAPAPALTGKAGGQWEWHDRRNDQSGSQDIDRDWPLSRPATTLAGRDLVGDPGANSNRFNDSTKSRNDGIKITVAEALTLQSFRPDYPVQGTKTKQFEQIGNAVPPLLAAHVISALTGRTMEAAA